MEKKVFWKSKTLWVAFLTFLYGILPYFGVDVEGGNVAMISSVIFTVLRFMTSVEIGLDDIKE